MTVYQYIRYLAIASGGIFVTLGILTLAGLVLEWCGC